MYSLFQMTANLQAVFIDTFYNTINPKEVSKFNEYTAKLMEFADEVKPFECKDIQMALPELREAYKKIADLEKELEKNKNNEDQSQKSNGFAQIGELGTALIVIGGIIGIGAVCLFVYRGFLERSRDSTFEIDENIDRNNEETVNVEQDGDNEEQA